MVIHNLAPRTITDTTVDSAQMGIANNGSFMIGFELNRKGINKTNGGVVISVRISWKIPARSSRSCLDI